MKVKSLIETMESKSFIEELAKYFNLPFYTDGLGWQVDFDELRCFYNQPFHVDMICKYFKYFSIDYEFGYWNVGDGEHCIEFIVDGYDQEFMLIQSYPNCEITKTFTPRTLDDFINDCLRVGIELEWRPL